jgi:hypothetical protein
MNAYVYHSPCPRVAEIRLHHNGLAYRDRHRHQRLASDQARDRGYDVLLEGLRVLLLDGPADQHADHEGQRVPERDGERKTQPHGQRESSAKIGGNPTPEASSR